MTNTSFKLLLGITALYLFLLFILDFVGVDVWLAKQWYQYEGMTWSLKHHWLTENVIHQGGRLLNYVGVIAALSVTLYWHIKHKPAHVLDASRKLCLSLLLSFISINYLKAISNIDCPWDLSVFGGDMPYIHLFADKPDGLPIARCFPAGHASAGYAWIALFYFFSMVAPRWRLLGLSMGLGLGLIFGFGQQLRGAHFLSHDLTTLFICWLIAFWVFRTCHSSHNAMKEDRLS